MTVLPDNDPTDTTTDLETTRILLFLAISFGIAVATAVVIYLTGGLTDSPNVLPGVPIPLHAVLLSTIYMWSPAIANVLTRLITGEGTDDLYLRPNFTRNWKYWLAALTLPGILTVVGVALYYGIFPQYLEFSAAKLAEQPGSPSADVIRGYPGGIWGATGVIILMSMSIVPLFNAIPAFGEEFGWRGYLLPKLVPLGGRKAVVIVGVIWGVWHWPTITMGHNYGLGYAGAPWLGYLAFVWFTTASGIVLGWLTLRTGSVWPAAIGHGAINAIFSFGRRYLSGDAHPALGPEMSGVIAASVWAIFAVWLLYRSDILRSRTFVSAVARSDGSDLEASD